LAGIYTSIIAKTPIKTPFLGVFLCLIATKKPPPEGQKIPTKDTHPAKPKNTLFLALGVHLGVQLGVHFWAIFRVVK
jgi:hypothetical protein